MRRLYSTPRSLQYLQIQSRDIIRRNTDVELRTQDTIEVKERPINEKIYCVTYSFFVPTKHNKNLYDFYMYKVQFVYCLLFK